MSSFGLDSAAVLMVSVVGWSDHGIKVLRSHLVCGRFSATQYNVDRFYRLIM